MDHIKLGLDASLIEATRSIVEKKLHPNQEKLDKNKNGKLDKDDFKILRGEKSVKEETDELDEDVLDELDEDVLDELSNNTLLSYQNKVYGGKQGASPAVAKQRAIKKGVSAADLDSKTKELKKKSDVGLKRATDRKFATDNSSGGKTPKAYIDRNKRKESEIKSFDAEHQAKVKALKDKHNAEMEALHNSRTTERDKLKKTHDSMGSKKNESIQYEELTKEQYDEIEALAAKHGLTGE